MNRRAFAFLSALAVGCSSPDLLAAQAPTPVRACSILPKEEVKRHVPWEAMFDRMEPEENAIGASGSACAYPSVEVQVLPATSGIIDSARERGQMERISGIGEEAYFYNNSDEYAEVYVRAGRYIVTVQADAYAGIETVKPGALDLARALVARLPG